MPRRRGHSNRGKKSDPGRGGGQQSPGAGRGSHMQNVQGPVHNVHGSEQNRDQAFQSLEEMFRETLDADVIHMVLVECDWKVDDALESLITLSGGGTQQSTLASADEQATLSDIASSLFTYPTRTLHEEENDLSGPSHYRVPRGQDFELEMSDDEDHYDDDFDLGTRGHSDESDLRVRDEMMLEQISDSIGISDAHRVVPPIGNIENTSEESKDGHSLNLSTANQYSLPSSGTAIQVSPDLTRGNLLPELTNFDHGRRGSDNVEPQVKSAAESSDAKEFAESIRLADTYEKLAQSSNYYLYDFEEISSANAFVSESDSNLANVESRSDSSPVLDLYESGPFHEVPNPPLADLEKTLGDKIPKPLELASSEDGAHSTRDVEMPMPDISTASGFSEPTEDSEGINDVTVLSGATGDVVLSHDTLPPAATTSDVAHDGDETAASPQCSSTAGGIKVSAETVGPAASAGDKALTDDTVPPATCTVSDITVRDDPVIPTAGDVLALSDATLSCSTTGGYELNDDTDLPGDVAPSDAVVLCADDVAQTDDTVLPATAGDLAISDDTVVSAAIGDDTIADEANGSDVNLEAATSEPMESFRPLQIETIGPCLPTGNNFNNCDTKSEDGDNSRLDADCPLNSAARDDADVDVVVQGSVEKADVVCPTAIERNVAKDSESDTMDVDDYEDILLAAAAAAAASSSEEDESKGQENADETGRNIAHAYAYSSTGSSKEESPEPLGAGAKKICRKKKRRNDCRQPVVFSSEEDLSRESDGLVNRMVGARDFLKGLDSESSISKEVSVFNAGETSGKTDDFDEICQRMLGFRKVLKAQNETDSCDDCKTEICDHSDPDMLKTLDIDDMSDVKTLSQSDSESSDSSRKRTWPDILDFSNVSPKPIATISADVADRIPELEIMEYNLETIQESAEYSDCAEEVGTSHEKGSIKRFITLDKIDLPPKVQRTADVMASESDVPRDNVDMLKSESDASCDDGKNPSDYSICPVSDNSAASAVDSTSATSSDVTIADPAPGEDIMVDNDRAVAQSNAGEGLAMDVQLESSTSESEKQLPKHEDSESESEKLDKSVGEIYREIDNAHGVEKTIKLLLGIDGDDSCSSANTSLSLGAEKNPSIKVLLGIESAEEESGSKQTLKSPGVDIRYLLGIDSGDGEEKGSGKESLSPDRKGSETAAATSPGKFDPDQSADPNAGAMIKKMLGIATVPTDLNSSQASDVSDKSEPGLPKQTDSSPQTENMGDDAIKKLLGIGAAESIGTSSDICDNKSEPNDEKEKELPAVDVEEEPKENFPLSLVNSESKLSADAQEFVPSAPQTNFTSAPPQSVFPPTSLYPTSAAPPPYMVPTFVTPKMNPDSTAGFPVAYPPVSYPFYPIPGVPGYQAPFGAPGFQSGVYYHSGENLIAQPKGRGRGRGKRGGRKSPFSKLAANFNQVNYAEQPMSVPPGFGYGAPMPEPPVDISRYERQQSQPLDVECLENDQFKCEDIELWELQNLQAIGQNGMGAKINRDTQTDLKTNKTKDQVSDSKSNSSVTVADKTVLEVVEEPIQQEMYPESENAPYVSFAEMASKKSNHKPRDYPPAPASKQRYEDSANKQWKSRSPAVKDSPVEVVKRHLAEGEKVLILMRGCPGSGKSTLARQLLFDGIILSTDDFFTADNGDYLYEHEKIGDAHDWNHERALKNMELGVSPVIIDNTNSKMWEMKPYVVRGIEHGYKVEIFEPNTPWQFRPGELARRNSHAVTKDRIIRMIDRYDRNVTVEQIVGSSDKIRKRAVERQQAKIKSEKRELQKPKPEKKKSPLKKRAPKPQMKVTNRFAVLDDEDEESPAAEEEIVAESVEVAMQSLSPQDDVRDDLFGEDTEDETSESQSREISPDVVVESDIEDVIEAQPAETESSDDFKSAESDIDIDNVQVRMDSEESKTAEEQRKPPDPQVVDNAEGNSSVENGHDVDIKKPTLTDNVEVKNDGNHTPSEGRGQDLSKGEYSSESPRLSEETRQSVDNSEVENGAAKLNLTMPVSGSTPSPAGSRSPGTSWAGWGSARRPDSSKDDKSSGAAWDSVADRQPYFWSEAPGSQRNKALDVSAENAAVVDSPSSSGEKRETVVSSGDNIWEEPKARRQRRQRNRDTPTPPRSISETEPEPVDPKTQMPSQSHDAPVPFCVYSDSWAEPGEPKGQRQRRQRDRNSETYTPDADSPARVQEVNPQAVDPEKPTVESTDTAEEPEVEKPTEKSTGAAEDPEVEKPTEKSSGTVDFNSDTVQAETGDMKPELEVNDKPLESALDIVSDVTDAPKDLPNILTQTQSSEPVTAVPTQVEILPSTTDEEVPELSQVEGDDIASEELGASVKEMSLESDISAVNEASSTSEIVPMESGNDDGTGQNLVAKVNQIVVDTGTLSEKSMVDVVSVDFQSDERRSDEAVDTVPIDEKEVAKEVAGAETNDGLNIGASTDIEEEIVDAVILEESRDKELENPEESEPGLESSSSATPEVQTEVVSCEDRIAEDTVPDNVDNADQGLGADDEVGKPESESVKIDSEGASLAEACAVEEPRKDGASGTSFTQLTLPKPLLGACGGSGPISSLRDLCKSAISIETKTTEDQVESGPVEVTREGSLPNTPLRRIKTAKSRLSPKQKFVEGIKEDIAAIRKGLPQDWALPDFPARASTTTTAKLELSPETTFVEKVKEFTESGTYTSSHDFVLLYKVQKNLACNTADMKVLDVSDQVYVAGLDTSGSTASGSQPNSAPGSPKKRSPFLLHKGCITDEISIPSSVEEDLKFLESCFPTVSQNDLKEILDVCSKDVEWAVNLLLDSGYEYNTPKTPKERRKSSGRDDDKDIDTAQENSAEAQILKDKDLDLSSDGSSAAKASHVFQPGGLVTLSQSVLTNSNWLTSWGSLGGYDMPMQMPGDYQFDVADLPFEQTVLPPALAAEVSQKKEDRDSCEIPDLHIPKVVSDLDEIDNIEIKTSNRTDKRMNYFGLIPNPDTVSVPDIEIDTRTAHEKANAQPPLQSSTPKLEENKYQKIVDTVTGAGSAPTIEPIVYMPIPGIRRLKGSYDYADQSKGDETVDSFKTCESSISPDDTREEDVKDDFGSEDCGLSLEMSPEMAVGLQEMFGPVGFHVNAGSLCPDDLKINLTFDIARLLHEAWAKTLQEKLSKEEVAIEQMLKADEELARQLQNEEDAMHHVTKVITLPRRGSGAGYQSPQRNQSPQAGRSPKVKRKYTDAPSSGITYKEELPSLQPRSGSPVTGLQQIMAEEMAMKKKREEEKKKQVSSGSHDTMATRMKRQKLYEMYPGLQESVLDEIFESCDYALGPTVSAIRGSTEEHPASVFTSSNLTEYEEILVREAEIESTKDKYLGKDESASFQAYEDPDYQDYRAEASLHYRLRHECFQKAQEAYRRGMKEVATFYSQQGHMHTEKIKAANRRASERILNKRSGRLLQSNTLDLHGLHVSEAIEALEDTLERRQRENVERPDKKKVHLYVVTGRGAHSKGGIARIKPAVVSYLNRNGYRYTEPQAGMLRINVNQEFAQ